MSNIISSIIVGKVIGTVVDKIKGALPSIPNPATVNFKTSDGSTVKKDQRVKIRIPEEYYSGMSKTQLGTLGGIIFPYTPIISVTHKAEYSSQTPLHSNFAINFYKSSSITPITISGKFTVQNDADADMLISIIHTLRALTKMKYGSDSDSGAPPPVCRLDAYGTYMLENVPVSISEFKIELPDNVDYYTTTSDSAFGKTDQTSVPTVCTISLTCIPMYSRSEMQKYSVNSWIKDSSLRKGGYL